MSLVARLAEALSEPPPPDLLTGDLVEGETLPLVPAAVLVAVTARPEPGLLLTVRREHLRTHAGQVAFPGGRIDPGDSDAEAAARREAEEELGLPRAASRLIGIGDVYRTLTGYAVTPVIVETAPNLPLRAQESEVADWFEAPLPFVLDPANQQRREGMFRGAMRVYYEIPWNGRMIWGATAAMLVNLSKRVGRWN